MLITNVEKEHQVQIFESKGIGNGVLRFESVYRNWKSVKNQSFKVSKQFCSVKMLEIDV